MEAHLAQSQYIVRDNSAGFTAKNIADKSRG